MFLLPEEEMIALNIIPIKYIQMNCPTVLYTGMYSFMLSSISMELLSICPLYIFMTVSHAADMVSADMYRRFTATNAEQSMDENRVTFTPYPKSFPGLPAALPKAASCLLRSR